MVCGFWVKCWLTLDIDHSTWTTSIRGYSMTYPKRLLSFSNKGVRSFTKNNEKRVIPSLLIPIFMHFLRRQYWHWFLWCWSIGQFLLPRHEYVRFLRTLLLKNDLQPVTSKTVTHLSCELTKHYYILCNRRFKNNILWHESNSTH